MLAHTLNKMLNSMFRHEQSEDIGPLMLPAIGKCAIMPFLTVLQSVSYILSNYGAEAEAKEEAVPKPPPVGPTEKLRPVKLLKALNEIKATLGWRVVCAWIGDDLCGDGDLPAWSSVTCSVQSDYSRFSTVAVAMFHRKDGVTMSHTPLGTSASASETVVVIQSQEGIPSTQEVLRRFNDFLNLYFEAMYGDNSSMLFHPTYGFDAQVAYGQFSPVASPLSPVMFDGQLFSPHQVPMSPNYFSQPVSPHVTSAALPTDLATPENSGGQDALVDNIFMGGYKGRFRRSRQHMDMGQYQVPLQGATRKVDLIEAIIMAVIPFTKGKLVV
ncbi:hypothetical protein Tco_0684710 [Tanacetum coccineum]